MDPGARRGVALLPEGAVAAELDGRALGFVWAVPFIGILLSIALFPLLAPHAWEHHQGKIAALWAALVLVPMAFVHGTGTALGALAHGAFRMSPSSCCSWRSSRSPAASSSAATSMGRRRRPALLAIGAALASFIGTTGASMVMIRPVLRANDDRRHNAHVVVFFIFLVSNIGGSLTPLGDPPLFLGFLRGVDFFWTTRHLLLETLFVGGLVLAAFFLLDTYVYRKEGRVRPDPTPDDPVRIKGGINFLLIGLVVAAILMSATVRLGTVTVLERNSRSRTSSATS